MATARMEVPHTTEFASTTFYNKAKQLRQQQHNQLQQHVSSTVDTTTIPTPIRISQDSQFILPIRDADVQPPTDSVAPTIDSRPVEKEKRGLFRLGRKRPAKTSTPVVVPEIDLARRQSVASVASASSFPSLLDVEPKRRCALRFDQHFLNLPNELQVQVVASMPLSDILNLRLASRGWHEMVTYNETPIVRYHVAHHIPAYALRLYPVNEGGGYTFHFLCGIWHRLHVAAKLSNLICEWSVKEIFLRSTPEQRAEFAPQRERMRRRLIPLLFTAFHFFENYRILHLKFIKENGYRVEQSPYTLNPIEAQIMSAYDDRTLLQLHQTFPLIISSFCRRLRPPSYVGRVERTVRGYLRDKPSDEIHAAILCLGGLRQVERIWEVKGYNTRRGAVDTWCGSISMTQSKEGGVERVAENKEVKPKRTILGIGRRKSTWGLKDADKTQHIEDANGVLTPRGSLERRISRSSQQFDLVHRPLPPLPTDSLVFNTSLAAGMPMGQLEQDDYKLLISDLPVLQEIWHSTAEALILERGIVERKADIKRNAAVMLDLIGGDGMSEEDEWWYGRGAPESLRPSMQTMEEDD